MSDRREVVSAQVAQQQKDSAKKLNVRTGVRAGYKDPEDQTAH
jgi:hypothetical protein